MNWLDAVKGAAKEPDMNHGWSRSETLCFLALIVGNAVVVGVGIGSILWRTP